MKREIRDEEYLYIKGWSEAGHGYWIDPLTKSHLDIKSAISIQERRDKGICDFSDLDRMSIRILLIESDIKIMKKRKKWYQFWK